MHFGRLCHITVLIWIIVCDTVMNIEVRIVLKVPDQILVENDPVLPVQNQSPETNRIGDELHVIVFCKGAVFEIVFTSFPDDLFNQMPWRLDPGAVRMKPGSLILILNKFL